MFVPVVCVMSVGVCCARVVVCWYTPLWCIGVVFVCLCVCVCVWCLCLYMLVVCVCVLCECWFMWFGVLVCWCVAALRVHGQQLHRYHGHAVASAVIFLLGECFWGICGA